MTNIRKTHRGNENLKDLVKSGIHLSSQARNRGNFYFLRKNTFLNSVGKFK